MKYTYILFFIIHSAFTMAQTLSGKVIDSQTGEPLQFAIVQVLNSEVSTYTDEQGQFIFELNNFSYDSLRISYVGFQSKTIRTSISASEKFIVKLYANVDLPTIDVIAPIDYEGNSSSILAPSVSDLKSIPSLLGENDLLKSLSMLPGISNGLEGTAGIHIRGGNASQTNLLIDDVQQYNVNHIGGFLSSVPSYGVKSVVVYKGGIPPEFGGRLGGVLDIKLKDGRTDRRSSELTIGTGLIRLGSEGPIGKKSSYLISGRIGYPTLLYSLIASSNYSKGSRGNGKIINLGDFVAKLNTNIKGWNVSVSSFLSTDWGLEQNDFSNQLYLDEFNWLNMSHSLKVRKSFSDRAYFSTSIGYLNYGYSLETLRVLRDQDTEKRNISLSDFDTKHISISAKIDYFISNNFTLRGGINALKQENSSRYETQGDIVDAIRSEVKQSASTISPFAQIEAHAFKQKVQIMAGLRGDLFKSSIIQSVAQPRIRASIQVLENLYINSGFDRTTQFEHQLRTQLAILPNDLWLLSGPLLKPSLANQFYAGLGGRFSRVEGWAWSIEGFKKTMTDLARIRPGREQLSRFDEDINLNNIAINGEGKAIGLEFFLRKDVGKDRFWVSYTLSKSERKYDDINNGEWFPFTFDRRHDLNLRMLHKIDEKWSLSATFIYQTGISFTAPVATTVDYDIYDGFNNAKFSPFHVLNVGATKSWRPSKHHENMKELSFSIYNLYNRPNAYAAEIQLDRIEEINPVTGSPMNTIRRKVVSRSLLPIVPGFSYKMTFGR